MLKIVVKLAMTFEIIGMVLLMIAFVPQFGAEGIWISAFTAISAFCNAGFDLFGRFGQYSSLAPYVSNYYVQAVIMFLIMAGGLGFMVWVEIGEWRKKRHLSLHARMVLLFSCILWVGGAVLIGLMEWNNPKSMGGLSVPGKVMAALFQSVSTRTAGMNTIDLAACGLHHQAADERSAVHRRGSRFHRRRCEGDHLCRSDPDHAQRGAGPG